MKLWKSPVLYFGIALILTVAAAFVAPFIIDWGSYRTAIENYGSKMTGRQVTVAGDISGRLFPWPKLTIHDVKVANPPGAFVPDFVTAEEVEVRMTLAGLLGGEIRVETIDVIRPVIAFERLATGDGSWHLKSQAQAGDFRLLDRIRLDQITVTDGTLHLIDNRRSGKATITQVNATLAAQNFVGPWRLRGMAAYRDRPIELAINTGIWTPDAPFKFGFRIGSADGSGLVYQFDGVNDGNHVTGGLRIQPAASVDGRSDAEGQLRPLVMTAQVTSDFDTVALDKIEISPRDGNAESANLLTGSAEIALGANVSLKTDLRATRFDLDQVAGAKAKGLLREGGGLALLENTLGLMPDNVDIDATLGVTSLVVGGEALDNAKLAFAVNQEAISIKELSAGMPGQGRGLFTGTFLVTDSGPQLAGDLAGEAGSLRDFVSWAWPEGRNDIAKIWTGSRGRFKLQTRLDATYGQLRLQDLKYQIDESQGSGGLTVGFGERPALDIRLDASALDIDRFVPNGLGSGSWLGTAGLLSQWAAGHDLRLTLQSGETRLNGVDARDVAIDIAAINGNIDLKTIEIGNVGAARLEITGLLAAAAKGHQGSISTGVTAQDPRSLLQLLGLLPQNESPAWAEALGQTDLTITTDLKPDEEGQSANFRVAGKSGDIDIQATLAAAGQDDFLASEISADFSLRSATGAGLLKLAGLRPVTSPPGAAKLMGTLTGSLANGLVADLKADAFGAKAQFQGKFLRRDTVLTGTGRAGLFAERPNDLFVAAGVANYAGGAFSIESDVEVALPRVVLPNVQGFLAGAPLSGTLSFDGANRLKGEFSSGVVSFSRLFDLAFMPWDGRPLDVELPFAFAPPLGFTGELWIKPAALEIADGLTVKETQIGISAGSEEVRLAAFGKSELGGDVAIEIGARPQGGGKALDGRLVMPIDLARSLKDVTGKPVAKGLARLSVKVAGAGRTPGAVLASLTGSGSYDISGLEVANIDPERFVDLVRDATTGDQLKTAFTALSNGGVLAFGDAKGILKIADGTVTMPASAQSSAVADTRLEPRIDLPDGRLDANLQVKLKALQDEPHFAVTYSGRPNALTRFVDVAALESKLGFGVVERTLKELEKLQAEQQKLMEDEERQRREDEAKLDAYYEQRREMQRRLRELRVHREMRARQPVVVEESPPAGDGQANAAEPPRIQTPPPAPPTDNKAQVVRDDPTDDVQPLPPDTGDDALFGPPPPPKPKPQPQAKRQQAPAKAQARSDPGAPLVLVPPQKRAQEPPPRDNRSFFDRLFGRKP